MPWKQTFSVLLVDCWRLIVRFCLFIDLILLALFSVWFVSKFLFHFLGWLDRILFSKAW
ncbi:MAG: hypothetical protein JW902_08505 [Syntrophaceae bacterium]|nr:hypothetical protein [Syntrophaceae bacterium]